MEGGMIFKDVIVKTMNNATQLHKNVCLIVNDNTIEIHKYIGEENEERWVYPMINIMYYTVTYANVDHREHGFGLKKEV